MENPALGCVTSPHVWAFSEVKEPVAIKTGGLPGAEGSKGGGGNHTLEGTTGSGIDQDG